MGAPFQYQCRSLARYRSGDHKRAAAKLAQTWFQNPYLVSRRMGMEPDYVTYGPTELLDLWDEEALFPRHHHYS